MKEELNLKQNLCVARVFLNIFGFYLEDVDKINSDSIIKIYNKKKNEVGYLYFEDDNIFIDANYTRGYLKASYKKAFIESYKDSLDSKKIYKKWSHKINFNIFDSYSKNIWGEFLVTTSIDNQSNKDCSCSAIINYKSKIDGDITLKIQRDEKLFDLLIKIKPIEEHMTIDNNGSILHDKILGDYVKDRGYYRRRRVLVSSEEFNSKDKIQVSVLETELENIAESYTEEITKLGPELSKELLIQKGELMNKINSYFYGNIYLIQRSLMIDDIFILDNLISVCYDKMDDEIVKALFNLNKKKNVYQNGAGNLVDAYFNAEEKIETLSINKK